MELFDIEQFHLDQKRYRGILNRALTQREYQHILGDFWNDYNNISTIISNWEKVARQIPTEMVECRRKKSPTQRYQKLIKEYKQYHEQVESFMVMFSLLHN